MNVEDGSEFSERQKIILNLNRANHEILQRINRMTGGQVDIDPTGGRMEMFFKKMIEWGVITADQMEEFNLAWVNHLNSYLMLKEAEIRSAIKEAQRRSAGGLAVPNTSGGLIVPEHLERQNGTGKREHRRRP